MRPHNQASLRVIFALTLVHFTGDFYSAFTTPLFPAFMDKLNLTLAQVGLIAGVNRFLSFVVQPVAGYLADRYQGRAIILGGLLMAVVFIPLSGIADGYWMLMLFIALARVDAPIQDTSWINYALGQIGLGLLVGLVLGWVGGLLMGRATRRGRIEEAYRQLCLLALAVVILSSRSGSYVGDLNRFLFGSITGLDGSDVIRQGIAALIALVGVIVFYRAFLVMTFDVSLASMLGLRPGLAQAALRDPGRAQADAAGHPSAAVAGDGVAVEDDAGQVQHPIGN